MKLTKEQKQEIADQQSQKNTTKRVTSLNQKIFYEALPVLDHGFVRVVDYMGDDSLQSNLQGSHMEKEQKVSTDEGLIKYLMRHWHSTLKCGKLNITSNYQFLQHDNGLDIECKCK